MVLLALCVPCCSPARLPRWPRATVTTPNSAADMDPMMLLGLKQAEKMFEVRPCARRAACKCSAAKRAGPRRRPRRAAPVWRAVQLARAALTCRSIGCQALRLPAPARRPTPGARRAQGHPLQAAAQAFINLIRLHQQQQQQLGVLEPLFEALARAAATDPLGDELALLSKVPTVPDPLLLGTRNITGGSYGEGPHGRPGGVDVSLTAARFGPCVLEGGAEVAGAYAHGVRVAPTGLAVGATGAKVAPTLIEVAPELIDVNPTGVSVSPALVDISPALVQVAPGFVAPRPGTVAQVLDALQGFARAVGVPGGPGAAAPPPT